MLEYFFVYGTLKEGFNNHHIIKRFNGELVDYGTIQGILLDYNGRFPVALESEDANRQIQGEIYVFPEETAALAKETLDHLEGYNEDEGGLDRWIYKRLKVLARGSETSWTRFEVWAYFGHDKGMIEDAKDIHSDVWNGPSNIPITNY